jgi:hypothetical protein
VENEAKLVKSGGLALEKFVYNPNRRAIILRWMSDVPE